VKRIVILLALVACSNPTVNGTSCTSDSDCNLFNVEGTCESTGFCSYPDSSCAGGQRYSPGAGSNLANSCVGGEPMCGKQDQPCCGTNACGPNLVCSGEAGTCQCGAVGQPCCAGTTCGTGFACASDATCKAPVGFTQVAVGKNHICALAMDQTVWCWGYDMSWGVHVAGQAESIIASLAPAQVTGLSGVAELRAGEGHTCARKMDNTLWCWGHNEHGQLGNGSSTSSATPVQVTGITNVLHFDAGRMHTCAVASFNNVAGLYCWGRGGVRGINTDPAKPINPNLGRLGNNNNVDSVTPVAVDLSVAAAGGATVKSISTGNFHSCMVMSDNTTWCWGGNVNGELGNGTNTDTKAPVKVDFTGITLPLGVTVDEVSVSDGNKKIASSCVRWSNGAIYCWGNAAQQQLGDNTATTRNKPSTPALTSLITAKAVQLTSANTARCVRAADGTVWCWGENYKGMLGIGRGSNPIGAPTPVVGLSGVTQLDMSHRTACAIDGMNRLFCWGNNQRGQIRLQVPADKTSTAVLAPQQIVVVP